MKIIVQSDDLGITEAVSCGIEKGIRDGVVTCFSATCRRQNLPCGW